MTMTTEQALKVLDDATSMLRLNRNEHNVIAQALNTLKADAALKQKAAGDNKEAGEGADKKDATKADATKTAKKNTTPLKAAQPAADKQQ